MKRALFYLIVFLIIQLLASVLFAVAGLVFKVSADTVPMLIASSSLASVAAIALFAWKKWTPVNRVFMQSRPWVVLVWSVVAALGAILPSMGLQDLMPDMPNLVGEELEGVLKNRWGYFAIGLAAPVAEEFVFRGAILRTLLSWARQTGRKHWTAILLSAVLFSVAHLNPAQMIHAFLIGLLLGWMYYRTGSIIPGIVYHWVNNSVAYVMENLLPNAEHLSDLFGGNFMRMGLSIVFSLCILLPALFQLNLNMHKVEEA